MDMEVDGLQYNESEQRWTVVYPWIRDPIELPNNVNSCMKRLKATESRLKKAGKKYHEPYDNEIANYKIRGTARKLCREETESYSGPVHYIPHHEVLKPESESTSVRIVFDSPSKFKGHKLNDYWAKGPDIIKNLVGVFMRFRQGMVGIAGDISKMYSTVKLSVLYQHTHRFLWRDLEVQRDPDHYALHCMTFGDKPRGAIATLVKIKTAATERNTNPEEVHAIERNSYVDDLLHSVDEKETTLKFMNNVEEILSKGGFVVKHWITSADVSTELANH